MGVLRFRLLVLRILDNYQTQIKAKVLLHTSEGTFFYRQPTDGLPKIKMFCFDEQSK